MAKLKTSPSKAAAASGLTLILHAHAPYVRQPGRSAVGEEPLHGLIIDTYVPLLAGLYDLVDRGVHVRLGLALSPVLLEQLADPVVQKHTLQSLEHAIVQADQRTHDSKVHHDEHATYLAQFYGQLYRRNLQIFERQWSRNLIAATRTLAEAGVIEVVAQTATHLVPHLHERDAVRTQLETGMISIMRHLGQRPTLLWAADDPLTPELLELLPPLGISGVVTPADAVNPVTSPYWLDAAHTLWAVAPDPRLMTHIHSTSLGYPGDPVYRATVKTPLADGVFTRAGTPYDPFHAYARARFHAQHFVAVVEEMAHQHPPGQPAPPLILATAMELFGSGWFEGGVWLRSTIEELTASRHLSLQLPNTVGDPHLPIRGAQPIQRPPLPGDHAIIAASRRLRAAVARYPRAYGDREQVLNQAARELLLAQSGDWDRWDTPAAAYAHARRKTHLERLERLLQLAETEVLLPVAAHEFAKLKERDNPFPALNYRLFGSFEER